MSQSNRGDRVSADANAGGDRGWDDAHASGDATDLTVQASFRGVVVGHTTLRHRARAIRRDRYRVGVARGAAPAPADRLEGASFVLVEDTPLGLRVNLLPSMSGNAVVGSAAPPPGLRVPLATWQLHHGASFLLPVEASLHLSWGEMDYRIQWSAPPPPVRGPLVRLRWSEQRYTVGTAIFFLLAMLLTSLLPPDARALSLQRLTRDYRLLAFSLVPLAEQERARQRARALGGSHPGPARAPGAIGKPTARIRDGRLAIRKPTLPRPVTASSRLEEIRRSGVLGIFRAADDGSAIAALLSSGSALGEDPQAVLGQLDQLRVADSYGIGGFALRGTGAFGAGTGEKTIGVGGLGTTGLAGIDGTGPGSLTGRGRSLGDLPARRPRALEVVAERPAVRGGLDKEIIRRVVRRHLNEIRYCYEQELPRAPALSGRLAVRFTIASSGAVAAAILDSTSLANPRVEICALEAVRRWAFPQPQGGGIVIATYPFTFVPAGQAP